MQRRKPIRRRPTPYPSIQSSLLPRLHVEPYQRVQSVRLPGTSSLISCSALGVVSSVFTLNEALVPSFATRYTGFDEFRILKVYTEIRPVASTSTSGLTIFFIDENDNTPPTLSAANVHIGNSVSNNGQSFKIQSRLPESAPSGQVQEIVWSNNDISTLGWNPIGGSTTSPAFLKVYTDNVGLGTPAVAQPLFVLRFTVTIQFRGQK